ncbi:hypothetical protein CHS0354_024196 [Potamilus streckersoni]|uniref:Uncharacterized protein n=1 Tax=Potamilus streckersoni TaxID=2493646 RepID=A0AAE0VP78_9BIVA|nr:hypothetical protein CHS0354_024196 [Potamilus streckersoni]
MDFDEDAALCPVCCLVYDDPRSLPCGHSFCLKCISQVANNRNQVSCPSCRKVVYLQYQGAYGLPKNYGLIHIIEGQIKMWSKFCRDHKKSLDLFCEQCDVVICSKCLLSSHSGHKIVDIEDILSDRKGRLTELLESAKQWQAQIENKTDEIRSSQQLFQKTAETIKTEIDDKFRSWSDDLEKRRQTLQRIVDNKTEQSMKVYDNHLTVLHNANTEVNKLQTEISTTLSKDTASIVQLSGTVEESHNTVGKNTINVMETPLAPRPNLEICVSAPWIEEAIQNIKLFQTRQGQTTSVACGISKILEENKSLRKFAAERQEELKLYKSLTSLTMHRENKISDQLQEEMRNNNKLTEELENEKRSHKMKYTELKKLIDEQKQINIMACEEQFENLKRHLDDREDCLLSRNQGAADQDTKYICGDHHQRMRANNLK